MDLNDLYTKNVSEFSSWYFFKFIHFFIMKVLHPVIIIISIIIIIINIQPTV